MALTNRGREILSDMMKNPEGWHTLPDLKSGWSGMMTLTDMGLVTHKTVPVYKLTLTGKRVAKGR